MSETTLIAAEEWHEKMLTLLADWDYQHGDSSRGTELDVIRDIQRNAELHWLERAAKAACPTCVAGNTPRKYNNEWWHGTSICPAMRVRQLIPKDPAPEVKP